MAELRVYDQQATADPAPVLHAYEQSVDVATSQPRLTVYDQAVVAGALPAAPTAVLRVVDQAVDILTAADDTGITAIARDGTHVPVIGLLVVDSGRRLVVV